MTPEERAKALCLLMGRTAYEDFVVILRHARREAYEKAAKVAEAADPEKPSSWLHRREDIAASIRRLAEEGRPIHPRNTTPTDDHNKE